MADTAQNLVAAQSRSGKGKGPARRLREQGLIPAVVYGLQAQPTPVAVDPGAVMKAIATPHKRNTLITLQLEAGVKRVLFKDLTLGDFFTANYDGAKIHRALEDAQEGRPSFGGWRVPAFPVALDDLPDGCPIPHRPRVQDAESVDNANA